VYSSLMMKSVFFHHHEPNPALVWSKGGGGLSNCRMQLDRRRCPVHTPACPSLSFASPHLRRDCAWSSLVVVPPACSRGATQHL
jgi:hypothetical protein